MCDTVRSCRLQGPRLSAAPVHRAPLLQPVADLDNRVNRGNQLLADAIRLELLQPCRQRFA
jgi:hypothetical protein